jgi:hypothetical protein
VFEFAGNASDDNLIGNIIVAPATTTGTTTMAAIFGNSPNLRNIVIRSNTVSNGSSGIYMSGTNATNRLKAIVIDSNTVNNGYNYGIYTGFTERIVVNNNTVNVSSPSSASVYGIYATTSDTAYRLLRNTVNINNVTSGNAYGLYLNSSNSPMSDSGIIASNTIIAASGNTANVYGLINYNSSGSYTINNVIAITSGGNINYGLHHFNSSSINYYNNSVNVSGPASLTTYAAYLNNNTTSSGVNLRNNIFSNKGAGRAVYINAPGQFNSDYNMLYSGGTHIIQVGSPAASFDTLKKFTIIHNLENWSIVYEPAFTSNTDLRPNVSNPNVWAIHGRGIQVAENSYDFLGRPRPTTLKHGVPDLGAYEFFPAVDPTLLTATLRPDSVQIFMYGSDTVMQLKWRGTIPTTVGVKRFSGVRPPNLPATLDSMFFYTKVEIPGGGNYSYNILQHYIDPWQGSIDDPHRIGLGRTLPSNSWVVGFPSRVEVNRRVISESNLTYLDKFTGLVNPYAPIPGPDIDSSNRGKRFFVGYPVNQLNRGSGQGMVLYLSAEQTANVQVKIHGTGNPGWFRNYTVNANTVKVTDVIPQNLGDPNSAYYDQPGQTPKGISIISDVPIVAYAHIYGSLSSGASMLLPVGVWGYEYKTLTPTQEWGSDASSYFYVIAAEDNTAVEITSVVGQPLRNTTMTPGAPFRVTLNKGEWYQVIGSSSTGDLTGSIIRSVANSAGNCFPIAVYSGSSRTRLNCPTGSGGGGDFMMQQVFPNQAWGQRYLTSPSAASNAANLTGARQPNVFRVLVQDPNTVVRRNGNPLTPLINNSYYQFTSSTSDYIEADQPVMVGQFLTGACTGVGDPEMIYISPIEQGIDRIGFYRNTVESIDTNYLNIIVPTAAVPSVRYYEGVNPTPLQNWTFQYPHQQNGSAGLRGVDYTVLIKRWTAAQQQVRVTSDSAFTAITYGLASVESYGYNAGTLVKNLKAQQELDSIGGFPGRRDFTCALTCFQVTALLPFKPDFLTFRLSRVPIFNCSDTSVAASDVTLTFPVPYDSVIIAGTFGSTKYYKFRLPGSYMFKQPNIFRLPIRYSHFSIEACDKTKDDDIFIQVLPAPITDFAINFNGCLNGVALFKADSSSQNNILINSWTWRFHNNTTATGPTSTFTYTTAGNYDVTLRTVTEDGCVGENTQTVAVGPGPIVTIAPDSLTICAGDSATFIVQTPATGVVYNWYDSPTGGNLVHTGTSYTVLVTGPVTFYVEGDNSGCVSTVRKRVTVTTLPQLPAPVVTATVTNNSITWNWTAITNATGYQVSVNGGTAITPSSGATGLSHTITGLSPIDGNQCLVVTVLGLTACEKNSSVSVCDQVGCPRDTVRIVRDIDSTCVNGSVTYSVQNPVTGATYYLFDAGGTAIDSQKTTFVISPMTTAGTFTYFIGGKASTGCTITRTAVTAVVLDVLPAPVVTLSSSGPDFVSFTWQALTGATSYVVSTTGPTGSYTAPTGPGLIHTISNLQANQTVDVWVKALGALPCQESAAGQGTGTSVCTNFAIQVVRNVDSVCTGNSASFSIQNYNANWSYYLHAAPAGNIIDSNKATFTINNIPQGVSTFYIKARTPQDCVSDSTVVTAVAKQISYTSG